MGIGSTRSLFFSDIEGSTALLQRVGDLYEGIIVRHREIVRAAVTSCSGVEHGTEGDSFFVTFGSPVAAVRAAIAVQLGHQREIWPNGERVRARVGLHIGDVLETADGLFGVAIHHAARVMATAHGGQIVVSEQLHSLTCAEADFGFRPLGFFRLRDVGSVPLFQVVHGELEDDFPALRAPSELRTNLPEQWSSFVGRDAELEQLTDLLRDHRLVTLIGPGGTGKTRLALQAVADLIDSTPGGVWLAELARGQRSVKRRVSGC